MNSSRRLFKMSLRKCKKEKDKSYADNLANKFLSKDTKTFWDAVKQSGMEKIQTNVVTVGGASGSKEICEMWRNHYSALLNSSKDISSKSYVLEQFDNVCSNDNIEVSHNEVDEAIKKLKRGKTKGKDNISSEHILHSHSSLSILLSVCFKLMFSHGHIPHGLMDTIVISLLKDKKGNTTDKDNYRPIAITCAFSKVLEIIILNKCTSYLETTCHQFGFKNGVSTDSCLFSFKEIINYYNALSTPVYVCMLDSSKAFDRVNHYHLFNKLLQRGMPILITRLLFFWYQRQAFYIKWDGMLSRPFSVSNGVRQGGILSPKLFNMYIDELSNRLINSKVGCHINGRCFNHICYADDAVIMAPSPYALQELLNICQEYSHSYEMYYNIKKTVCMKFLPKAYRHLYNPSIFLDNNTIKFVGEHTYLGTIISSTMSDNSDIARQIRSTYTQGNAIISRFKSCSRNVKIQLFKTYCYNLYNCQLWCSYTCALWKRMKVAYNNVFRRLLDIKRGGSVSHEYVNANVNGFDTVLRKSMWSMYTRLLKSDNVLIKNIISSTYFLNSSNLLRKWKSCLYTLP